MSRGRYRPERLTPEDADRLLLALGQARQAANRHTRSIHFSDPRRQLGADVTAAIDALVADMTGDKQFFHETGTTISGWSKLVAKVKREPG